MTDAPSPFDDPDFVEMLKRSGVTHRPGMADELMEEIGPLLAADGFDVDGPQQDMDFDDLNAAMSRAVERRNMELVTPVGEARTLTMNLLHEFVMAYHAENFESSDAILGRLRPDPTTRHPSFSHLIGVALEMLDVWHTDKSLLAALSKITIADMPAGVKPAATELEALARKGRAFGSIERLLFKHNGAVVAAAGAYMVAASVTAVAVHQHQSIRQVLDELLPGEGHSGGFGTGAAFGLAAADQVNFQDHLGQFEAWLIDNEDLTNSTPEDIEVFETIVEATTLLELDPYDPDDFAGVVDIVLQLQDPSVVAWSLAVLHDYVHFRMEDDDARLWEEPHAVITETAADTPTLPPELKTLMDGLENIPAEDRFAAVTATPLITGIAELMEWIGKSKPVTSTGMPKRSDIGVVAAMIGIDAQGVAKSPPLEVTDETMWDLDLSKPASKKPTLHVQSAKEIAEFRAWWAALEIQEGIELSSTRVMPGPTVQSLVAPGVEDLELLEMFVVSYIREYFLGVADELLGGALVVHVINQLVALAEDNDGSATADDSPGARLGSVLSIRHLRSLESMGLLEIREANQVIAEALRPVVVLGAMLALADLELAQ